MKHILLMDMDAFFIMCETVKRPELLNIPAAVGGDPKKRTGIIVTSNYKAREYGIKTAMTVSEALKLCPHLTLVPSTHGYYSKCSRDVFEIIKRYSPLVEQASIDEGFIDVSASLELFGTPMEIAEKIQKEVKDELGLWCSFGISENKFLAKMACGMKKPLGITTMYKNDIEEMLWPLPVKKMHGIGKVTAKKLNNVGLNTIGDIVKVGEKYLVSKFGKHGRYMFLRANGIDEAAVGNRIAKNQSISKETTLSDDVIDVELAKKILIRLANSVGVELRKKKTKCSTIQIILKYNDFTSITRQKTIKPTNLTKDIVRVGVELIESNWDLMRPIRLIGVSVTNYDKASNQISLFDEESKKDEDLEKVMDKLNDKYGGKSALRGNIL